MQGELFLKNSILFVCFHRVNHPKLTSDPARSFYYRNLAVFSGRRQQTRDLLEIPHSQLVSFSLDSGGSMLLADVAELADALDSGSSALYGRGGSSPLIRTCKNRGFRSQHWKPFFVAHP